MTPPGDPGKPEKFDVRQVLYSNRQQYRNYKDKRQCNYKGLMLLAALFKYAQATCIGVWSTTSLGGAYF